jgi:hypothetical protein
MLDRDVHGRQHADGRAKDHAGLEVRVRPHAEEQHGRARLKLPETVPERGRVEAAVKAPEGLDHDLACAVVGGQADRVIGDAETDFRAVGLAGPKKAAEGQRAISTNQTK